MANASEERLKQLPEYDEKDYESMAGLGERPVQQPKAMGSPPDLPSGARARPLGGSFLVWRQ